MHHKFTPKVTATNRLKLFILWRLSILKSQIWFQNIDHTIESLIASFLFPSSNYTIQLFRRKIITTSFFTKRAKFKGQKKSTKFAKPCFFVSYLPAIWKKTPINLHNPKISLVKAKKKLWKKNQFDSWINCSAQNQEQESLETSNWMY